MPAPQQRRTANRHPELTGHIRAILAECGMHTPEGRLILCTPRDMELRFHPLPGHPSWSANNGKVCFETLNQAERAADGIAVLPGADPVVVYGCPRGGHFHHVSAARRRDTSWAILTRIAVAARRARGAA